MLQTTPQNCGRMTLYSVAIAITWIIQGTVLFDIRIRPILPKLKASQRIWCKEQSIRNSIAVFRIRNNSYQILKIERAALLQASLERRLA